MRDTADAQQPGSLLASSWRRVPRPIRQRHRFACRRYRSARTKRQLSSCRRQRLLERGVEVGVEIALHDLRGNLVHVDAPTIDRRRDGQQEKLGKAARVGGPQTTPELVGALAVRPANAAGGLGVTPAARALRGILVGVAEEAQRGVNLLSLAARQVAVLVELGIRAGHQVLAGTRRDRSGRHR